MTIEMRVLNGYLITTFIGQHETRVGDGDVAVFLDQTHQAVLIHDEKGNVVGCHCVEGEGNGLGGEFDGEYIEPDVRWRTPEGVEVISL